jgi:hypothetical protein
MDQLGGRRRLSVALAAALVACAAFAAPAPAINVTNVTAVPADQRAGANSDFSIGFGLSGGSVKDLVIHLPPGLVGNPLATTTCKESELNADACPAASKVGTIANNVQILNLVPQTATGNIYNVKPRQGEPARFGFVLNAPPADKIILQSPASLRPSDFGLDTTLNNLPQNATVAGLPVSITITGASLTLKGKVGSPPQGFLRNPTSCGTHTVSVDATAYDNSTGSGSATFDTTDCQALPFSPKFSADIVKSGGRVNAVAVSTTIGQTIEEAGLKRAIVTLPSDLGPNNLAFSNTCDEASFQAGTCPENTIVGTARAASPLQDQALTGPVMLLTPPVAGLPLLGLDLRGPLALKLEGLIGLDATNPSALRTQVTFDGLPDIPISDFTLTFAGGPLGLNLAARSPCEPPPFRFDTSFLSHADTTAGGPTNATSFCGKGKPSARIKLKQPKSGGDPSLRLALKGGAARIAAVKLKAPKGVSFGHGSVFKRGAKVTADGRRLKARAHGRGLNVKAKGKGAAKIKGRFTGGAVRVKGKVRKPFKLVVRDADGKKTKLSVKAK